MAMRHLTLSGGESAPRVPVHKALGVLLRGRRRAVLTLIFASILSGFAESATLAILAETAATIATGAHRARVHIGPLHVHPQIDTLFEVALALVIVRLLLQIPLSILPPRIASDMQAELR